MQVITAVAVEKSYYNKDKKWLQKEKRVRQVDTESTLSPTAIHFVIQKWNTLKNFHSRKTDMKKMQVLLRVDSHHASVTAGLKWAEHSQKPITALIFIFNRYLCQNIFSYLLQSVLMFNTVLFEVYLITY